MTNNFFQIKIFLVIFLFCFLFVPNKEVFALTLTATENVTVSANVVGASPTNPAGNSGSIAIPQTTVRFSGQAYPNATVTVLKNTREAMSVLADNSGFFSVTLEELYDSTVLYTLFAVDVLGNKSILINYPIVVLSGFLTHLSGILFAPTVLIDKTEVKAGDYLTVSGYSLPNKELEVAISGQENNQKKVFTLTSFNDGSYKIIISLTGLPKGNYVLNIKYTDDPRVSKLVKFVIGEVNILSVDLVANIPGDCNADGVINLVDFSILAFWYGKSNPPRCVDTNHDNKIDLTDFSILAFWWTG